jgi:uncharacterized protein DUF4386
MMISTIDDSQRRAARVAGLTYLFGLAAVIVANFGVHERLIVAGDAAQTAHNIMAHERLFRLGIALDLFYCACLLLLITALYVILEPINRNLALLAAFRSLVYALMWILMTLNLFDVLRLLSGADYLRVFETERLQALARSSLRARFDEYYFGLLFYGMGSAVWSYLWFKSKYIPRPLAAFGVIAFVWAAACSLAFIIFPNYSKVVNLWWFDSAMGIFEIATGLWLLFKGLRPSGIKQT